MRRHKGLVIITAGVGADSLDVGSIGEEGCEMHFFKEIEKN